MSLGKRSDKEVVSVVKVVVVVVVVAVLMLSLLLQVCCIIAHVHVPICMYVCIVLTAAKCEMENEFALC